MDRALEELVQATPKRNNNRRFKSKANLGPTFPVSGPVRRRGPTFRTRTPYSRTRNGDGGAEGTWQHDLFRPDDRPQHLTDSSKGVKIRIKNLRFDVLEDELTQLFSACGNVLSTKIIFDHSGRSEGRAEVVFKNWGDAERAVREYNGRTIDGEAMVIHIVGLVPVQNAGAVPRKNRGGMRGGDIEYEVRDGTISNQSMDEDLTSLKIQVSF